MHHSKGRVLSCNVEFQEPELHASSGSVIDGHKHKTLNASLVISQELSANVIRLTYVHRSYFARLTMFTSVTLYCAFGHLPFYTGNVYQSWYSSMLKGEDADLPADRPLKVGDEFNHEHLHK